MQRAMPSPLPIPSACSLRAMGSADGCADATMALGRPAAVIHGRYLATRSEIHVTGLYINVSKMIEVTKDSAKIGNWFKSTDTATADATPPAANDAIDGAGSASGTAAVAAEDGGARPRTAPAPDPQHVELNLDAIDADFLAHMPEDIRNELLAELGRQRKVEGDAKAAAAIAPELPSPSGATAGPTAPAAPSTRVAAAAAASSAAPTEKRRKEEAVFEGYASDSIDPAVLASLPPSIRREITQQINRPTTGGTRGADAGAGSSGSGRMSQGSKKRGSTGKASRRATSPVKKRKGSGAGITNFFKQPPLN